MGSTANAVEMQAQKMSALGHKTSQCSQDLAALKGVLWGAVTIGRGAAAGAEAGGHDATASEDAAASLDSTSVRSGSSAFCAQIAISISAFIHMILPHT